MSLFRPRRLLLTLPFVALTACEGGTLGDDDGDTDGGTNPNCPAQLPIVQATCTDAACNTTTGTKAVGTVELSADTANDWIVVSYVSSVLFENDNPNIAFTKGTAGGLGGQKARVYDRPKAPVDPARLSALNAEKTVRENAKGAVPARGEFATGIRGRDILPPNAIRQDTECAATAPYCAGDSVCVDDGQQRLCQSMLQIKWRDQNNPTQFELVDATVRKVGAFGAIVTDDAITVSDADIETLSKRFEERIAPIDHQFFGEPRDATGKDFDDNGVVILFITSRIADFNADIVGFFQATDLEDPAVNDASNGADLLYLQPPGSAIDLDSISGTIAHEYEHLISYYAKVINRQSSPEAAWLDEGLATFAEDVAGYGADSFRNVSTYMNEIGTTSLTGFGLVYTSEFEADSIERRGMAHLFLRFLYEQRGGATYGSGPADVTDNGGIALINGIVQSPDTSVETITAAKTGRSLDAWLRDFYVAVAIDGAGYEDVSCNTMASFAAPETDAYTGFQRGLDLRTSISASSGTIPFNGPITSTFETEETPIPSNGGEIRTINVASGVVTAAMGGPAEDYEMGILAIPATR